MSIQQIVEKTEKGKFMLQNFFESLKKQRLAWGCAAVVAFILSGYGHAPLLPVLGGCLLAVSISALRKMSCAIGRGGK